MGAQVIHRFLRSLDYESRRRVAMEALTQIHHWFDWGIHCAFVDYSPVWLGGVRFKAGAS
jgi:hypothetical protein